MINRIKERTGIYGLGFASASVMGVVLPIAVVVIVGGLGWLVVKLFLS